MSDHNRDDDEGGAPEPRRGRPEKPADQRLTERIFVSFTSDEYRNLIHRAADADGGPYTVREYAKLLILNPANKP